MIHILWPVKTLAESGEGETMDLVRIFFHNNYLITVIVIVYKQIAYTTNTRWYSHYTHIILSLANENWWFAEGNFTKLNDMRAHKNKDLRMLQGRNNILIYSNYCFVSF
jgi:hypothetical protein